MGKDTKHSLVASIQSPHRGTILLIGLDSESPGHLPPYWFQSDLDSVFDLSGGASLMKRLVHSDGLCPYFLYHAFYNWLIIAIFVNISILVSKRMFLAESHSSTAVHLVLW